MQRVIETLFRIAAGILLLFFAFVPAWILWGLAEAVLFSPEELNFVAVTVFLVCAPLLYFFLLLSYRAFTGRGRKQDGGLLPPWALKVFASMLAATAIGIAGLAFIEGQYRAMVGGVGFMALALMLYRVVRDREADSKSSNEGNWNSVDSQGAAER